MIKKLYFLLSLCSFFLFIQCKNDQQNATTTPSVSNATEGFYKHLKGTVDTSIITMNLVKIRNNSSEVDAYNFRGHYYYDKYQQPIALYGELDSVGNIILHEANYQQKEIYFIGKMEANGSFSGTWQDTSSKKALPFTLKETYTEGVLSFDTYTYIDSVKAWKDAAKSPIGTFDMQVLLPAKNTEGGIADFLKDRIFGGIHGDTLEKTYATISLENFKNTQRDTFFKYYIETIKDEKPEPSGEPAMALNYAQSSTVGAIYNEKGLLSMEFGSYEYTGGAHGNPATILASYDLGQKKQLKLNDVFLPNFEKTLNTALEKAVRHQFDMKANDALSNYLFEDTVAYNDNFCLTKKGILFLYNPYEIAAYAYGEIELFVPFDEIKTIVNPRFLP